jgi:two-component system, OmpR family, sensor kinase
MSIRLRFTLLYNAILALTLAVFGISLYSIQAQTTYDALKKDLIHSSEMVGASVIRTITDPNASTSQPPVSSVPRQPPPQPFTNFSGDPAFQKLPEREIVRVLDAAGNLIASPFGRSEDALPLSAAGLQALNQQQDWWETDTVQDQSMLIYSRPVLPNGQIVYILQIARPLTERDRSLNALGTTLIIASLVTLLIAFGIGWVLSEITLQPIKRMTQTARAIGEERDFTRRVSYTGPQDEVGQLATTFNAMLARLQDAFQQVEHSLEMQRNFVADVSHELRTPLTTLRGNLGLLRREPPIPAEEQADILTDMVDESDRLIRLVNDLLVLAHADAGRNLAKESVEILPVLEETCRQAQQLDPQRKIMCEAADLSILGDRDALKQVFLIALDNALKHSTGDVAVSAQLNGKQVEIRVQDHGAGIPPEKLEHVFDRFYRGEESITIPGFGLGLPIAKALVEGMGGTIKMESEVGIGSVLTLFFFQPINSPK